MYRDHLSLVLLPTLKCNAACEYCFEDKMDRQLDTEQLGILIRKVLDFMAEVSAQSLTIYWQGGEMMLLPPSWYEKAYDLIQHEAETRGKKVFHSMQSNMLLYHPRWDAIIHRMFGSSIGTSLDYPNLYRRLPKKTPENYVSTWHACLLEARSAGIAVQVIAVPNHETIKVGATAFYRYFTETMGITEFQVNTPFPGGTFNATKHALQNLDMTDLTAFYLELADIWLDHGYQTGVQLGPFDVLLQFFSGKQTALPCIWGENCTNTLISIDARGCVAQCDCWVSSYADHHFGNIFDPVGLGELLQNSVVRADFQKRPAQLVQEGCVACDYLSVCHGGCPVRAYTVHGALFQKDPYCTLYKALFAHIQRAAQRLAREKLVGHAHVDL